MACPGDAAIGLRPRHSFLMVLAGKQEGSTLACTLRSVLGCPGRWAMLDKTTGELLAFLLAQSIGLQDIASLSCSSKFSLLEIFLVRYALRVSLQAVGGQGRYTNTGKRDFDVRCSTWASSIFCSHGPQARWLPCARKRMLAVTSASLSMACHKQTALGSGAIPGTSSLLSSTRPFTRNPWTGHYQYMSCSRAGGRAGGECA